MNKKLTGVLLALFTLVISSCDNTGDDLDKAAFDTNNNYYQNVEKRVSFDKENELNFKQTFERPLDNDTWYTLDGVWHTDGPAHNGVRRRNLFYTSDGTKDYLAIRGRGYFNRDSDIEGNKPEGGCIITKDHLGPGRYEIKMSPMPREGGVSTMWTYCTLTGNEATSQNEIDIELGGTTKGTHYEYLWSTSWTSKTTKTTKTVDATDICYMNDRQIHTFTFDWYTEYPTDKERRVDWFIDGQYVETLTGNVVPEHEMPLWVGLWFPPLWPGNPGFEEDFMLVEEISYQAFSDQYVEDCRAEPGYEKVDPNNANIQTIPFDRIKNANKLSNGDFETMEKSARGDGSYFGWSRDNASNGSVTLSSEKTHGNKSFMVSAPATPDPDYRYNGEYLYQDITDAYEGFKYDLKIDAKKTTSDAEGEIIIYYYDDKTNVIGTSDKIAITSTDFATYQKQITMPKDAYRVRIEINCTKGSILYDNASLIYQGN